MLKLWKYSDFAGKKTRVGPWDAIGNCIPFSRWFVPADEYAAAKLGRLGKRRLLDIDVFTIQACAFE
jgi:hypothetical protein